jgi:hypothetical protein
MPRGRHRAGFGLAIADDAGGDEVRIVEHRAIGVRQRITELAPLMDRARRLGRGMARGAAGKAELLEQSLHAACVLRHMRVDLAVGTFEPGIGDDAGAAMAGPGHVDHVEIARLNRAVQVHIDEVQTRRCAPMPQEARLDVLEFKRFFQQRIVEQVDLPDRQVVCGAPPGVDATRFFGRERVSGLLQSCVGGHH